MHAPIRSVRPPSHRPHPALHRAFLALVHAILLAIAPVVADGDEPAVTLEQRGMLSLPGAVVDRDGRTRPIAETSGVTWIGGDRYLAAMDGSDRALLFTLSVAPDGAPIAAAAVGTIALDATRDWEDVAAVGSRQGLRMFVVEEETPAVRGFLLDADRLAAEPAGGFSLRGVFPGMRPNRGPESLAAEPDGSALWTASEETLAADGPEVADGVIGRVRLARIPLPPPRGRRLADPAPDRREWMYAVDPPHPRIGLGTGPLLSGLVALAAVGEGRLLVLERSAGVGLPPLENRIYLVDVSGAAGAAGRADADEKPLGKTLLWRGALGANVEGLCAGPGLEDGRRVVVGIADNAAGDRPAGNAGPPNPLVVYTLTIP